MTIQKKILSIFMMVIFVFVSITGFYFNTYVMGASLTDYGDLFTTFTRLVGANDDVPINVLDELVFDAICPRDSGFIVRTTGRVNYELTKKAIATYLNHKYSNQNKTKDNITQSDINEFSQDFYQNVSYNDNSNTTTYNDNSKSMINLCINEVINDSPVYYVYSFNLIDSLNSVNNGDFYNACRRFINEYQDDYYIFCKPSVVNGGSANNDPFTFYLCDKSSDYVYVTSNSYPQFNFDYVILYDFNSWERVRNFLAYRYDYDLHEFNQISDYTFNGTEAVQLDPDRRTIQDTSFGWISVGRYDINICYRTLNDMKQATQGIQSYYINQPVYNNWDNSTGDYTVTTDNSNKATYGDITNYINSFNTETGTYPTPDDINHWITNYDPSGGGSGGEGGEGGQGGQGGSSNATATANNEGINITINNNHNLNIGGGSLSGNTVSGNGTGGSGTIGNIFDWLGHLGQVIGNFIKSAGEMIVEVIQGISEAVTGILETIPNIFTPLIEFVFGGLPEEVQHLITLGITCILLVGVIQMIRK